MVLYNLTRFVTNKESSLDACVAAIEAHLETVDNTKVIRSIEVKEVGPGKYWQGYVLHDT